MSKGKKLIIERNIFFIIFFLAFGLIIYKEKENTIIIPKVREKLNNYIETKYDEEKNNFNYGDVLYKDSKYTIKVTSKKNKNHYFYVYYKNKKITDTYKKDYLEGNTILSNVKEKLETEINKKTNLSCEVEITNKLNNFTPQVQKRILEEDNLLELKFYIIKKEIIIEQWNKENITNQIYNFIKQTNLNNIYPKNYKITITNKNDITSSIEITNITNDFLKNNNKTEIINDIISDNNSTLLKESKIEYKYLN